MRRLAPVALALLCGCATITRGTTQNISVDTPGAAGAKCVLKSSSIGTRNIVTPATLELEKGQEGITVRCQKECFQDGAGVIASNVEGMVAGNIIAGGVIGLGVDAATGAMNKYASDTSIYMTPIPGCKAR